MLKRTAIQWNPHDYQKEAVRFLLSLGAAGLWLDPGLGKTACVLYAFSMLLQARTARRLLVIAPMRVCRSVWPREAAKWKQTSHLRVAVLHGPGKEAALRCDADVYCINPEGLPWLLSEGRMKFLDADVLCIDEVTKFKHTNTARFKMLKPSLGRFNRRWTLTGTPAPNGFMDIFGQIYCLDLGKTLGPYITAYRNTYFNPTGFGGYTWELKEGAKEKIQERLRPLILRISDEVLDLPKLVFNNIRVQLPSDARLAYNDMEKKLITMLKDGTVVDAASAGVATGKCLQIANGGVYVPQDMGKRKAVHLHNAKVEALEDLLEEIQHKPALVLYSYDHDLQRLKAAFPHAVAVADLSARRADEVFEKWNRGEIEILLAQPQSIGHGLNLQGGGQHVIWFGLNWDLEIWEQAIRRLYRQGSEFDHVYVHCIIAEDTVDEIVRAVLDSKDTTQKGLLNAMRSHYSIEVAVSVPKARPAKKAPTLAAPKAAPTLGIDRFRRK